MTVVGWDWASRTHDVTVLGEEGAIRERWSFAHTQAGWACTLRRLREHGDPGELPVIIEKNSGLVIDRLLAAGHPVVPVHPTSFYAARPRWGASGAKSDPGDSYKLADYLRTDGHRLRRLEPVDPGLRELQALVRLRDDQVRARTAAVNQLTATLDAYWPGPRNLFRSLATPIALAFLTDYPTPHAAHHLGEARMAAFCRRHSYRGGKSPAELLSRLRSAPVAPAGMPEETLRTIIGAQVALLRTLQAAIADIEATIAGRVAEHPRARLLERLPGVGIINLAQLLAEVGPILDRVDNAEQAATECGAAPVTKASGKTTGVYFRWAANTRARKAVTAFAHNARLQSPWAGRLYADARARGKRNPHANRNRGSGLDPRHLGVLAHRHAIPPHHPPGTPSTSIGGGVDLGNSSAGSPTPSSASSSPTPRPRLAPPRTSRRTRRRPRLGTGPGGHCGASQESSAVDLPPHIDTSDQPLPGPAAPTLQRAKRPRKTTAKRCLQQSQLTREGSRNDASPQLR